MKITFVADWRDLWIGIYFDRRRRRIYVLPLPCFGFCIHLNNPPRDLREAALAAYQLLIHGTNPGTFDNGVYFEAYGDEGDRRASALIGELHDALVDAGVDLQELR